MKDLSRLPFNSWSRERIAKGKKICTSRNDKYDDPRVSFVLFLPLRIVRDFLWLEEGATGPAEFEKVWRSIHRGRFDPDRYIHVHFGDFSDEVG